MKTLKVLLCVLSLSACTHLSSRSDEEKTPTVETRDVTPAARAEDEAPHHRLLVLPFLDERPDHAQAVLEASRQAVVHELARTHQFIVVTPEDFPQDPKKFLNEDNEYDLPQVAKIANGIGVAAVLEGKVLSIKAKRIGDSMGLIRQLKAQVTCQVRVRIFAGKNGKEILNEVRTADTDASSTRYAERGDISASLSDDPELVRAAIRKAFVGAMPNITRAIEKLSWEGRVAMVSGERVFVNAGRISGLQIGDILKVTEEGDDVYDPESGRFIGAAPGRLKGTVEVVSYFGKDGSIAVIHSGSGFQENDRVELY
jgi:TolB-like protein